MDFISGITTPDIGNVLEVSSIFKLLFLVLVFGYLVYVILLTLRVRILTETVNSATNKFASLVSYIHLLFAVIGSFLAVILVLVG